MNIIYPIANDSRYQIKSEFCGHSAPRYVLRFCGEFVASSVSIASLSIRSVGHNAARQGALAIEEIKS